MTDDTALQAQLAAVRRARAKLAGTNLIRENGTVDPAVLSSVLDGVTLEIMLPRSAGSEGER